ncbi:MAG: hypothetical protein ABSB79_16660 [Syntrophales bacterium]
MIWSSIFLIEIPMISGSKEFIASFIASLGSFSARRSRKRTSCPAFHAATATQFNPNGKGRILIRSVLAEIRRTLMAFSLSGIFNGDYTTFPLKETNQLCLYSRKQIDEINGAY